MRALFASCRLALIVGVLAALAPPRPLPQDSAVRLPPGAARPDWRLAMPSVVPIAFKKALFAGRNWKVALYSGGANLGVGTVGYSATGEVTGPGYTATGLALTATLSTGVDGTTAILDFLDSVWTDATFTARYALVYDANAANKEGFVIDFGSDQAVSSGTFTIQWPLPDQDNAILRQA